MAQVLLGLGSNIQPEYHLKQAVNTLTCVFSPISFAAVYHSKAVGMEGEDFLNSCCLFYTALPLHHLRQQLKTIEDAHGRDRIQGSWQPRTLDLDVLMYDGVVIDDDIYRHAHVFVPASELVTIKLPHDTDKLTTKISLMLSSSP